MPDVNPEITNTPPSSHTPLMKRPNNDTLPLGSDTLPLGPSDPTPAPKTYDAGGTIGRYVIDRLIGRGGMANIFLATDPTTQRQVAIKLMPYQFNLDAEMRARFQREARVIAGLEHANVVQVYDVGEDNEQLYIVMRYMAGGSLAQRMKDPIPTDQVIQIGRQIAAALDDVHTKGIVHRDLKPDNILFDAEGNAYLSDFGIVKLAESKTLQTATGVSAGTPAYMSPEQIEAKVDLDGRSDIYALAIILFEMLSGRAPYVADTPIGLVAQHLFDPVPQIRTLKPELPIVTQGVIERGMAKDRDERYETAAALMDELEAALDGRLLEVRKVKSAAGRGGAQVETEDRRRVPLWAWPAGIFSLGAVLAMLFMFSQTYNNSLTNGPTQTPIYIQVVVTDPASGREVTRVVPITLTPDPNAALEAETDEPTDEPTPTVTVTPTRRSTTAPTARPTNTTQPTDAPAGSNSGGSNDAGSSDAGASSDSGGSNSSGSNDSGSNSGGLNTGVTDGLTDTGAVTGSLPATDTPRPPPTSTPRPPTSTPVPPTSTPQPSNNSGGLLGGLLGGLIGGYYDDPQP